MLGRRFDDGSPTPALLKRIGMATLVLFLGSVTLLSTMIGMGDVRIINDFWPFQIGLIYMVSGVFLGRELVWIGLWLAASAVASLYMAAPLQEVWLAAAGGGGLFLTGLLMWRQVRAR